MREFATGICSTDTGAREDFAGVEGFEVFSNRIQPHSPGQLSHIRTFREHHPDGEDGRVSQGLVVIPTDSASSGQRAKYEEYARQRLPRTARPQGPGRLLFAPDHVGTSDEVAFALPFTFDPEDHEQILTDMADRLGPALGWRPTAA